jgi:hypothetical protein
MSIVPQRGTFQHAQLGMIPDLQLIFFGVNTVYHFGLKMKQIFEGEENTGGANKEV